ncbi:MAG: PGF-pre-PGF domain-containing protein [Candidatus Woesearchaeota archaeon]
MKKHTVLFLFFMLALFLMNFSHSYLEYQSLNFEPLNETKTKNATIFFSYKVISNVSELINCDLLINGNSVATNQTNNNTLTYVEISSLTNGENYWQINCTDTEGNLLSDVYKIIIDRQQPNFVYAVLYDNDKFLPYNSLLNLSVSITDELSNVNNVSFDLSEVCQDLVLNKTQRETDNLWWASCNIDVNQDFSLKNIKIYSCDDLGNCGNIANYSVMIYNFTYPNGINEEGNYLGFDTDITTNLQNVQYLNNTNYVLGIKLNGSNMPGKPFEDIKLVALLNFSNIDFTNPLTYNNFANLPYAINITIKDAKEYYEGSRIFINTALFSAFDTETEITLYNLPFTFADTEDIFKDDSDNTITNVRFDSNNDGTGNLTFKVSGFSGYNITDKTNPVIVSNYITSEKSTTFVINVSLNGTGTEINKDRINLKLYSNLNVYYYNYTNLTCELIQNDNNQSLICNATLVNENQIDSYNLSVFDYGGSSGLETNIENCFNGFGDYSSCIDNLKTRTKYCYGILFNETISCSTSSGSSGGSSSGGSSSGGSNSGVHVSSPIDTNKASQIWQVMMPLKPNVMKINNKEIGLSEITINVNNPANNVILKIEKLDDLPKESKEIKGKIYKFLKIEKQNLLDDKIDLAVIKFKVEKDWLKTNNINEDNVILKRYNNKWQDLETKKTNENETFVYYESYTKGFSYFAIAEKEIIVSNITQNNELSNQSVNKTKEINETIEQKNDNLNNTNDNNIVQNEKTEDNKKTLYIILSILIILIVIITIIIKKDKIINEYREMTKK